MHGKPVRVPTSCTPPLSLLPNYSCPALRVPEPPSQTLPRASGSARISLQRVHWLDTWLLTTTLPTTSCTQFRTSAPRACTRTPNLLFSRLLCNPLRSQLWSRLIRTPSPLPRAELPLSIHYADLLQGRPPSTSLSREEPALAPIEPVHQAAIMAAEVRTNGDAAAVPAASKTEWYAGATRFELELEV